MGQVITLGAYRDERRFAGRPGAPREKPSLSGEEVWGRNYAELESVVFGLLKVREILEFHGCLAEDTDQRLIEVLDAAFHRPPGRPGRLPETVHPLKDCIAQSVDAENHKQFKTALIVLDLIEKSPQYKETPSR
jgi:hypothetical protein